jgi:endonuclease-8/formamidopyrimidine-DNA glycosylase
VGEREVADDGPGLTGETSPAAYAGPPAPVGAVRVRLVSDHGWADLRGATTCAAITDAEAAAVLARLGPDPLHNTCGSRDDFIRRILAKRTPVATLLMDQKVIAGVGNVYRAEVLFRGRIDPLLPGRALSEDAAGLLWDDTAAVMADGVRDGRIITTTAGFWTRSDQLPPGEEAHFVYRRHGQPCRVCGTTVALAEHAARKLYWCPSCQQPA